MAPPPRRLGGAKQGASAPSSGSASKAMSPLLGNVFAASVNEANNQ
jgi:hypothetical protein